MPSGVEKVKKGVERKLSRAALLRFPACYKLSIIPVLSFARTAALPFIQETGAPAERAGLRLATGTSTGASISTWWTLSGQGPHFLVQLVFAPRRLLALPCGILAAWQCLTPFRLVQYGPHPSPDGPLPGKMPCRQRGYGAKASSNRSSSSSLEALIEALIYTTAEILPSKYGSC